MFKYRTYIDAVNQHQSFSKAAEALYISQPALSNMVKKEEKEIGLPLFDRSTNPISLTPAGEYYLKISHQLDLIEAEALSHFSSLANQNNHTFTVGASAYFCTHILPPLIEDFEIMYPDVHTVTFEANTNDLIHSLNSETIDVNIDVDELDSSVFTKVLWSKEYLVLAVPSTYQINNRLQRLQIPWDSIVSGDFLEDKWPAVKLSHFSTEPFLFMKPGNDLHKRVTQMCVNAKFKPIVNIYLDQMLTSYYIALEQRGICVIRSNLFKYIEKSDKICFYKIDDPLAIRNIYIYYKRNKKLSPYAKKFIEFLTVEE